MVPESDIILFDRKDEVSVALIKALRMIRDLVSFAATDPPKYKLGEGAVELSFEITKKGSISFFAGGSRESVATQTMRIKLKAPKEED